MRASESVQIALAWLACGLVVVGCTRQGMMQNPPRAVGAAAMGGTIGAAAAATALQLRGKPPPETKPPVEVVAARSSITATTPATTGVAGELRACPGGKGKYRVRCTGEQAGCSYATSDGDAFACSADDCSGAISTALLRWCADQKP